MATKEQRINIALSHELRGVLLAVSSAKRKSLSAFAKELIEDALERREDIYFSELSEKREKRSKKRLSHEEFWKRAL